VLSLCPALELAKVSGIEWVSNNIGSILELREGERWVGMMCVWWGLGV